MTNQQSNCHPPCPWDATLEKLQEMQWKVVERGGTSLEQLPRVSLPSAPVVEQAPAEETQRKIGDRVFVVADNYGSECTIIAYRDSDGPMASHWQVRTASGDRFWALDYEIME